MEPATLCKIADRVFVMESPFLGDKLAETRSFIAEKLLNKVLIFNLEDEEQFNIDQDLPNVVSYPTPTGCPTALEGIIDICSRAESFLSTDPHNHVIFHCKNGKCKSCLLAAAFMLHTGLKTTAYEAIQHINTSRKKNVLHQPSLRRYIYYFEKLLRMERIHAQSIGITAIRINSIPRYSSSITNAGCNPSIAIYQLVRFKGGNSYLYKRIAILHLNREYLESNDRYIEFSWTNNPVVVRGNVCICAKNGNEKMFQACFHTAFFEKFYLVFEKSFVDMASQDVDNRLFAKEFTLEVIANRIVDDIDYSGGISDQSEDFRHHNDTRCEEDN